MSSVESQLPIYPPLPKVGDALRLFTLYPSNSAKGKEKAPESEDHDQICGKLVSHAFARKPVYECLSYTWGKHPADKRITVNGQQFRVRKNLFNALRHLRRKDTPRSLWIDAICINQGDVQERNSQVSLMAFIYKRATRVLVWLGMPPMPYTKLDRQVMYIQQQKNCKAIVEHPYWGRVWIIQEITMAHDLLFIHGNLEFKEGEIQRLLGSSEHYNTLDERVLPLIKFRDRRDTDEFRLEELIAKFRKAQCSEKRDKIFGFLGMAHDFQDDEIEVDYTISLSELYAKLVDFHQASPPLQIHTYGYIGYRPEAELDRAVRLIKFSALVQRMLEGGVEHDVKAVGFASRGDRSYYARGAVAGEILYIGPTYSETISSYKANKTWKKSIETLYASMANNDVSELRRQDMIYSQNIIEWDEARLAKIRNIDSKTSFGFRFSADDDDVLSEVDEKHGWNVKATEQVLSSENAEPRRFLATDSRIGFAPPGARVGDIVCHFWDCEIAMVLRQLEDETNDRWRIIGRADLCADEFFEGGTQRIEEQALDCNTAQFQNLEEAEEDEDFMRLMNLKMDIGTLQQLTC